MEEALYRSIARAITFFDIFDHPLTDRELFEYLYRPPLRPKISFQEFVLQTREFVDSHIARTHGMWHLRGREHLLDTHSERSVYIHEKLKKLTRAARLMPYIPFVRSVFVCNTFAFNSADRTSDVDVFIIVKSGHMWTARICTTIALSLCGIRRTHTKVKDRICLSFYIADRALNISKFQIKDDVYLSYWLWTLIPVYDPDDLSDSILRANQELLSPFSLNSRYIEPTLHIPFDKRSPKKAIVQMIESLFEGKRGNWLENLVRAPQRRKIMKNIHSLVHAKDTRVVVNDSVLKFHENDRRTVYRDEWYKRLEKMGVSNYSN